jgi:hypothetical protein
MHLIKYQHNFNQLFTLSDYYTFKTDFISHFSSFYIFKTILDKNEGDRLREIWELKPKNKDEQKHRYFYFYISFLPRRNLTQCENSFTWNGLGEPNSSLIDPYIFSKILTLTHNLAKVPDVVFLTPTKVSFSGETYNFASKTKMLKAVTPILASKITSLWAYEEKAALARCILSKQQTLRNFKEFISHICHTKVRDFLITFSLQDRTITEIEETFSSYFNLYEQYIIYKF